MEWHEFLVAALAAIATTPLAFFFPDCPCCEEQGCGVADGKPRTDPVNEGTWVPSGTWRGVGGVTWSFTANPGDDSGETWFFFGSESTSKVGGGASVAEVIGWENICNWYSSKTSSPSTTSGLPGAFDKRATRLPPENAVVHIYSSVSTASVGAQTVKSIHFWGPDVFNVLTQLKFLGAASEVTATTPAHDSAGGAVFHKFSRNESIVNGGATFHLNSINFQPGVVNGGADFYDTAFSNNAGTIVNGGATFTNTLTRGTVNGGAEFYGSSINATPAGGAVGTINGGAVFYDTSENGGIINEGAIFNNSTKNFGTVRDGGVFNNGSEQRGSVEDGGTFNDTAVNFQPVSGNFTFNDSAINDSNVDGSATFNDSSRNQGAVFSTATFNHFSINAEKVFGSVVYNDNSIHGGGASTGGATLNDSACSERVEGNFFGSPCNRKFVVGFGLLPTCNGTAPDGCANAADTCGCG